MIDQMRHAKRYWLREALLLAAGLYIALGYGFHLVSVPLQSASAAGGCSFNNDTLVEKGTGPSGRPWTVRATVHENHGCGSWLLGMEFRPIGSSVGSSTWEWQIPVKGHLSNNFTLAAQDEIAEGGRAFYGTTSAAVTTVVIQMSKGTVIELHPKVPKRQLLDQYVWLRNLRYFMRFYPAGRHATRVTLYSADGKVIERLRGLEGEFDGPGI
jgi:hypothetical protein